MYTIALILFLIVPTQLMSGRRDLEHRVMQEDRSYTIHLMWINTTRDTEQVYLFPSGQHHEDAIKQWAEKNPNTPINFWYDSAYTTDQALHRTQSLLCDANHLVNFRDIRTLPRVQEHANIFSSQHIPVYFKVDLLRALIMEYECKQKRTIDCVYADLDVQPLDHTELLDQSTTEQLKAQGYVMAHQDCMLGFENGFTIYRYDEKLMQALNTMVIAANIKRAQRFLQEDVPDHLRPDDIMNNHNIWQLHSTSFQENIYYSYPLMHEYLCQLRGVGNFVVREKQYDDTRFEELSSQNAKYCVSRSSAHPLMRSTTLPTKVVTMPPSTSAIRSCRIDGLQ